MTKAKRKISDITFEHEGAHVALTHKQQGGPANNKDFALVIKARDKEILAKVQQIQVTLELPEFLRKFYFLYWDEAEELARVFGYEPPKEEPFDYQEDYEKWMEDRISAFTIVKSLKDSTQILTELSKLSDKDFLDLVEFQAKLEPSLIAKSQVAAASTAAPEDTSITEVNKGVSTSVETQNKDDEMPTPEKEMVEKSALVALQKTLDDTTAELKVALEKVAAFETEKKDAIKQARTMAIKEVTTDKTFEVVSKAALAIESDEDFTAFVSAMSEMKAAVEKSALFDETGASGAANEANKGENPLTALLKAKYLPK
jgi:hypothetical protein